MRPLLGYPRGTHSTTCKLTESILCLRFGVIPTAEEKHMKKANSVSLAAVAALAAFALTFSASKPTSVTGRIVSDGPGIPKLQALDGPGIPKLQALDGPGIPKLQALDGPGIPKLEALDGPGIPKLPALDGPGITKLRALD